MTDIANTPSGQADEALRATIEWQHEHPNPKYDPRADYATEDAIVGPP